MIQSNNKSIRSSALLTGAFLLASAVATEKLWHRGEAFSKGIGVASIVAAVAVLWFPELAPGLTNSSMATSLSGSRGAS